jgi:hypothetical protein
MTNLIRKLGWITVAGAGVNSVALAQSTQWDITYAPVTPASIPTLTEWTLLLLALMLGVAAFVSLRKKVAHKTLASVALVCTLALGGVLGDKVMESANANFVGMNNPAGGTVPTFPYDGNSLGVPNTSGVAQRIISISPTVSVLTTSPTCTTNLIVPPSTSCYIATTAACATNSDCSGGYICSASTCVAPAPG